MEQITANTHSFNVALAKELGDVNEVLILQHFYFWHQNNINKKETIKGDHPYPWTYNTIEQFCNIFPYMKKTKLSGAISRLVDKELLITGNYNKVKFDKTKWYSLTEKSINMFENRVSCFKKSGSSIKNSASSIKNSASSSKNAIPYSNTDSNTNTILDVPSVDDIKGKIFFKIVELYPANRIGNRQHGLKKFKKLDIEQAKLAVKNLGRYLKAAGTYVKSLQNYIEEGCWTEEWLKAEETKQNKPDITTKSSTAHNFKNKW